MVSRPIVSVLAVNATLAVTRAVPASFTAPAKTLFADEDVCAPAHWQADAVSAIWTLVYHCVDARVRPMPLTDLLEVAMEFAAKLRIPMDHSRNVARAAGLQIPLGSDDHERRRRLTAELPRRD